MLEHVTPTDQLTMTGQSPPQIRSSVQRQSLEFVVRRLAAVLFVALVAFGVFMSSANAAPADKLAATDAALWTKVLQTPSAQNSFGTGGDAFACWDLGGTVAPLTPSKSGVASCTVKPGTKIFVAGSTAECSTFEGDCGFGHTTYDQLKQDAYNADVAQVGGPNAPTVKLDGANVPLTEVFTSLLHIVLPAGNIFGLPGGSTGQAVAHGWVALLHPLTPGTHTIVIHSDNGNITTKIVVMPPGR